MPRTNLVNCKFYQTWKRRSEKIMICFGQIRQTTKSITDILYLQNGNITKIYFCFPCSNGGVLVIMRTITSFRYRKKRPTTLENLRTWEPKNLEAEFLSHVPFKRYMFLQTRPSIAWNSRFFYTGFYCMSRYEYLRVRWNSPSEYLDKNVPTHFRYCKKDPPHQRGHP